MIAIAVVFVVSVNSPIADHHLLIHNSLVRTPRKKKSTFTPLAEEELPTEGSVVGLDAEFVTLNQVRKWYICGSVVTILISSEQFFKEPIRLDLDLFKLV